MISFRMTPLGAAALVVVLAVGMAGTASAEEQEPNHNLACVRSGAAAGKAGTTAELAAFASSMRAHGATTADVDRAFTSQWCLRKVSGAAASAPIRIADDGDGGADSDDVGWLGLFLYCADPCDRYTAFGEYSWHNRDYMADVSDIRVSCYWNTGIGGKDAFALRLSGGEYQINSYSAYIRGDSALDSWEGSYPVVSVGSFAQVNQYGIGVTRQDNVRYVKAPVGGCNQAFPDLDIYGGFLILDFQTLDGSCRNAQIFWSYTHTWDSTSVTGISAGRDGFGIQWENRGDDFTVETAGTAGQVC